MHYKSNCKACNHPHDGLTCNHMTHKAGTIRLKSYDSSLWGISGGMVKGYDINGSEQLSFKQFNTHSDQPFEYTQEVDCGCRYYVPSENLEFLEWKYSESNK